MSISAFRSALFLFFSIHSFLLLCNGNLVENFYSKSCPQLEKVVRNITWNRVASNASHAAMLLRTQFNDCFVKGCDASILLDVALTTARSGIEKYDWNNDRLQDVYDVYDEIKKEVEKQCPNTVSCADIVALVARDSVSYQFGKSLWEVQTGRRDGKESSYYDSVTNLPQVHFSIKRLERRFADKGLSIRDLVVLSGAHTIGSTSCSNLKGRLQGKKKITNLNATYASELKGKCAPMNRYHWKTVFLDPVSSFRFDNNYYKLLKRNMGLFQTDAALLQDERTAAIVDDLAVDNKRFLEEFGKSMVKLGGVGVLMGEDGEIRKTCRIVNQRNKNTEGS
ncbi:peroxidase [Ranunculus cassubicifolius]